MTYLFEYGFVQFNCNRIPSRAVGLSRFIGFFDLLNGSIQHLHRFLHGLFR
jgi:hypothetical protein